MLDPIILFIQNIFSAIGRGIGYVIAWILFPFMSAGRWYASRGFIIKGLVGLWSYNGPAIVGAVREAGKIGRVRIIAFDEADETLAGIREGAIHATVVQQPFEFGYQAIVRMAQAARGDLSFVPASKQIIVPTLVLPASELAG